MVNQVGGNDSLVFDGSSLVIAPDGQVIAQAKSFEEDLIYFDSQKLTGDMHSQVVGEEGSAYEALVLGTRDYVHKCGFRARRSSGSAAASIPRSPRRLRPMRSAPGT
jgi:NAD+ synthase (glutamine-hydrolysing)